MFATTLTFIAATLAAPAPKEAKPEKSKVEGEWVLERYIQGGKEREERRGKIVTFKDGQVIVSGEDEKGVGYKIDPKAEPATLDLGTEGIKGIYKIEGDTLTFCFPKGGSADRPTKFESPAGTKHVLMILKRKK